MCSKALTGGLNAGGDHYPRTVACSVCDLASMWAFSPARQHSRFCNHRCPIVLLIGGRCCASHCPVVKFRPSRTLAHSPPISSRAIALKRRGHQPLTLVAISSHPMSHPSALAPHHFLPPPTIPKNAAYVNRAHIFQLGARQTEPNRSRSLAQCPIRVIPSFRSSTLTHHHMCPAGSERKELLRGAITAGVQPRYFFFFVTPE